MIWIGLKFLALDWLIQGDDELVADQGVTTRFFSTSNNDPMTPKIELLEPTGPDTPIGKFLDKRGPQYSKYVLGLKT